MAYPTYNDGKIKMYWTAFRTNQEFLNDPVDGLPGVRKWLLEVIPDNESILDIGCGPGHVSKVFRAASRSNTYLGIDNDERVLGYAKELFPSETFKNMDAHFIDLEDGSFDNCILFTVVEMLPDFRKPIDEAIRVAKKRVIITTYIQPYSGRDTNLHEVNTHNDYVVRINGERFSQYIESFGHKITAGKLKDKSGKTQYWYWIIEK